MFTKSLSVERNIKMTKDEKLEIFNKIFKDVSSKLNLKKDEEFQIWKYPSSVRHRNLLLYGKQITIEEFRKNLLKVEWNYDFYGYDYFWRLLDHLYKKYDGNIISCLSDPALYLYGFFIYEYKFVIFNKNKNKYKPIKGIFVDIKSII